MGELVNEILAQLKTITDFQFVTVFNNQFEYMESQEMYSFTFPCALLEIEPSEMVNIGENNQGYDVSFKIHIGQDYYNGANIDENLTIFDLRDKVYISLSKFKPTKGGLVVKTSEEQDFTHSNVYHYVMTFKTHWIDTTAGNTYTLSTPPTDLIITK